MTKQAGFGEIARPGRLLEPALQPSRGPVVRLLVRPLLRSSGVLVVASAIAVSLGSVYPIQHELDVAAYSDSAFVSEAPVAISPGEAKEVRRELGGADVALGSYLATDVIHGSATFGPADIFLISSNTSQDVTLMPGSTLVSSVGVSGYNWIDLSVDAAKTFGLTAGDRVEIQVTPHRTVSLMIRGVYAVRELGFAAYGQAPAAAVANLLGPSEVAPTTLFTTASLAMTDKMLNSEERAKQLEAAGYNRPFLAVSRVSMLRTANAQSSASLGLITAVALAALLALVLFNIRESVVYLRKSRAIGEMLDELGIPRKRTSAIALALIIPSAFGAIWLGAFLSWLALGRGLLVPTFPVALLPLWLLVIAAIGVFSSAITTAYAISVARRT